MSTTLAMLNNIRDNASTEYQNRIPAATRTNLTTIGHSLLTYKVLLNEFTTNLVEKIGLTIFNQKMYSNKLARFKKGEIINASDVEEIFVEMIAGVAFDPTGANPLGRRKPNNIKVMYHRQNFQEVYEVTISDDQVKRAFRSEAGIQELAAGIINAMYSGAAYDEYVAMRELLGTYFTVSTDGSGNTVESTTPAYYDYEVAPITDQATAKSFVKTVRKAAKDCTYVSTAFNSAGVKTFCPDGECVLFLLKDVAATIDVEVIAAAFNKQYTDINVEVVEVDSFGVMDDTYAILADKDFFMVFDTLQTVESIRNPQGLYTNYFLHTWKILSLSRFKNAIRFIKTPQTTPTPA